MANNIQRTSYSEAGKTQIAEFIQFSSTFVLVMDEALFSRNEIALYIISHSKSTYRHRHTYIQIQIDRQTNAHCTY